MATHEVAIRFRKQKKPALSLAQVFFRKRPIRQVIEPVFDIFRSRILIVEVIGVLPHIHGEERRDALFGERRFSIRGFAHFELAIFGDQPCPA